MPFTWPLGRPFWRNQANKIARKPSLEDDTQMEKFGKMVGYGPMLMVGSMAPRDPQAGFFWEITWDLHRYR